MEVQQQSQQIKYPRFIQNRPGGTDKFDGGSQERLAKVIARHFRQNDLSDENGALPRIIGIEGVWGSGKSNVVKMLERELSNDYYFFEYDAWGHQEDLQRRSILELMTSRLIGDNILTGKTTIQIKGGSTKDVSWAEKLKYLLARKTETVTEKYPLISNGVVAAFLVAVLTPIFTFIAYAVRAMFPPCLSSLWSIVIAALPVFSSLVVWGLAYCKNRKYGLSYLLAIYQNKIENDVCYETLSQDEPTVYEFKAWMQSISDSIEEKGQRKLVLVFDNMDRLSAEKVKELWSSIHTFFADGGFKNVWAVIPFDERHLACAFGDETDERAQQLTKYFINKTFPIVYRVAPPVITDYRHIIDKFFDEAFGEGDKDDRGTINRVFRLVNPNANVREIISFVNEMVALKQEWGNAVSMVNIALFCLKKTEILENPVDQILSGNYLNGIQALINNDERTQSEVAALVYGVEVEHARQIPLKRYIEGCISGEVGYDINKYAESNKQFDTILDEVVKNIDNLRIDNIIHCLNSLARGNDNILRIWQGVAQIKLKEPIKKQEFSIAYQQLLLHLGSNTQEHIIHELYKKIVQFENFNGADYFNALEELNKFIAKKQLPCDFLALIEEKEVNFEIFVDYLRTANESRKTNKSNVDIYKVYRVKTNAKAFDTYLAKLLPDDFNHADIVRLLKGDPNYEFPTLLQTIKNCIKEDKVNEDNIGAIFATYRLLASDKERPLSVTLDPNRINQLYSELTEGDSNIQESGYYDLVAMQLAHDHSVSLREDGDIRYVAELMDYYAIYGELLIESLSSNNPLLNSTLQYMVNHKLGYLLSLESVLPQFIEIKDEIDVTGEALVKHFANWSANLEKKITTANIRDIIPDASFYDLTARVSNVLTDHINKIAIEVLSGINVDALYNQRMNHGVDYWIMATKYLLPKIESLPDNLTELGKRVLRDIDCGADLDKMPAYLSDIIKKLDEKKIKATIKDIRNDFCNGKKAISPVIFRFFESRFRLHGDFFDRAGDVVDKIIKPVVGDETCLSLILKNKDYYINLVNQAGDDSFEFKKTLRNLAQKSSNAELTEFVNAIDPENKPEI